MNNKKNRLGFIKGVEALLFASGAEQVESREDRNLFVIKSRDNTFRATVYGEGDQKRVYSVFGRFDSPLDDGKYKYNFHIGGEIDADTAMLAFNVYMQCVKKYLDIPELSGTM